MSTLAERLKEVQANAKLTLEQWFAGLDDEDRDEWVATCANPAVPTSVLLEIVRDDGVAVGKDALATHRRGHGLAR